MTSYIKKNKSKYQTGMVLPIFEKHHRYIALNLWLVQGNITGIYICVCYDFRLNILLRPDNWGYFEN